MNTDRSESIAELAKALARAQGQIKGALREVENPHLRRKYADLASVWDACREALSKNGLAVIQAPAVAGEQFILRTILAHESGEWIGSTLPLLSDTTGRTAMQALGSALTYSRRYALMSMVGVCPEDDDGEAAGQPPPARQANGHARQDRAPALPPPITANRPHTETQQRWSVWLGKLLKRWAQAEPLPEAPDKAVAENTSRENRIANALITDAIEAAKLPAGAVLGPNGKREPAKVWRAVEHLCVLDWDFVKQATTDHLRKHVEPADDPPDGDPEFARDGKGDAYEPEPEKAP
jgi:hypothetical protein